MALHMNGIFFLIKNQFSVFFYKKSVNYILLCYVYFQYLYPYKYRIRINPINLSSPTLVTFNYLYYKQPLKEKILSIFSIETDKIPKI